MIPKKPTSGLGSEGFLREQLEASQKESKNLRARIDQLQRENEALKRSLYDLSTATISQPQSSGKFFEIKSNSMTEPPIPQRSIEDDTPLSLSIVSTKDKGKDGRFLFYKYQLEAHTGAVYTVQFSPNGRFLASGSFDKTVRLWDTRAQKELKRLEKHTSIVSDVAWFQDSQSLVSGSFDQYCNLWEIETGKLLNTYKADGFVQSLAINPMDQNTFVAGTTRKQICIFDKRKPGEAQALENNSMVNSVHVSRDGTLVITGDSQGHLKTWDLRMESCQIDVLNEPSGKPISHVHMALKHKDEEMESRYMAVNSYDNVLRVYDRGSFQPNSKLHLLHAVKGHRNQNWPIRSSFFHGKDHVSLTSRNLSSDGVEGDPTELKEAVESGDQSTKTIDRTLLLATGSADSNAYVFDVGGREGTGELIQKLEGHTDRVYSANFHPTEPILATCSADFTIKIWFANRRTK